MFFLLKNLSKSFLNNYYVWFFIKSFTRNFFHLYNRGVMQPGIPGTFPSSLRFYRNGRKRIKYPSRYREGIGLLCRYSTINGSDDDIPLSRHGQCYISSQLGLADDGDLSRGYIS